MMFMHIMEVDVFIVSYGQAGASFVSYRQTSFLKKSLLGKQLSIIIKSGGILLF